VKTLDENSRALSIGEAKAIAFLHVCEKKGLSFCPVLADPEVADVEVVICGDEEPSYWRRFIVSLKGRPDRAFIGWVFARAEKGQAQGCILCCHHTSENFGTR
jgi:hypothetical protein